MKRLARALLGLLLGIAAGAVLVLAIVAFRTAVEEVFLHSAAEVLGWPAVPGALLVIAGIWSGLVLEPTRFWRLAGVSVAGTIGGGIVGWFVGSALTSHDSGPWAGMLIGGGFGLVLSVLALIAVIGRDFSGGSAPGSGPRDSVAALFAFLIALTGCSPPPDAPSEARTLPEPSPSDVAAVLFVIGDPGVARMHSYPLLGKMQDDMEYWSGSVGGEAPIAMLVLGDIAYSVGLHPADHELRTRDSLRISDQIAILSGPNATGAGARGIFIAGNHDWGQEEDWEGARRLVRLQNFLQAWDGTAEGRLTLSPPPGRGGPGVIDLGPSLRLVLLDTAWWLLGSDPGEKDRVIEGVREALISAGDRRVVMAAHHPLESGGPHGSVVDFSRAFGLRYVLQKAGLLLQDLDSRPYRELRGRLRDVFSKVRPPGFFVGGHEHSLQVFASGEIGSERSAVIGSASKITSVRHVPGMIFGRSEPGYGKLFVLQDGTLHFRIEASPPAYLECENEDERPSTADEACLSEGVEAFRTVWAENLDPRD